MRVKAFLIISLLTCCLLQQSASANPDDWSSLNQEFQRISHAASLELNKDGFSLLSEVLQRELLNPLNELKVPDIEHKVPLLARLKLSGIRVRPKLRQLTIQPSEDSLDLNVKVRDFVISVQELRIESPFSSSFGSSCSGASVRFKGHKGIPVSMNLGIQLDAEKHIRLSSGAPDFSINRYQYHPQGPEKCVGSFGLPNALVRFAMKFALKHARSMVVKAVRSQLSQMVPFIENKINDMSRLRLPMVVPEILILPESRLAFNFSPSHLKLSREKMELELDVAVDGDDQKSMHEPSILPLVTFGIRPELINRIFAVLLRNGSHELEISPSSHIKLADILQVSEMSYFWPELNLVPTDSPYIKLFAMIRKAPEIETKRDDARIRANIPEIFFRAQIKRAGRWQDYFNLYVGLNMGITSTIESGKLSFSMDSPELKIFGHWADGYQPVDPSFAVNEMQSLFSQLLSHYVSSHAPFLVRFPTIPLYGRQLVPDHLRISDGWLLLDIAELVRKDPLISLKPHFNS